jgi:hypothetical protein
LTLRTELSGGLLSPTLLTMLLRPTLYKLVAGWFGGGLNNWRRLRRRMGR